MKETKKERRKETEQKKQGGGNRADLTGGLHAALNRKTPATYIN